MMPLFNRNTSNLLTIYITGAILIISSCKLQESGWDVDLLAPIAKTTLNLADALPQDYLLKDTAGLLKFVYSKNLFGLKKESFFEFYDTGVTKTFTIDSLSLFEANITYPITLGALARQSGATGEIIILLNGQQFVVPPIGPIASGKIPLSADTLFQSMTLNNGRMDISLSNGLPIEITNVEFELRNENDNTLIVKGVFPSIAVGSTETQSFDLSGKTVQAKMVAQVASLSSPGSGNNTVLIDTSDDIRANVRVYDLFPSTATAIWPSQNLINQKSNFTIRRIPVELTYAKVRTGRLRVNMFSTLQDSIYFTYELGAAKKNGIPFIFRKTLEPAPPGGFSKSTEIYSFNDYELDLTGKDKNLFNSMENTIIASIQRTGIMKTLSKNDSLTVNIQFESIDPEYVRGYMRDTTFYFGPDQTEIDAFAELMAKELNLQESKIVFRIENSMGVDTEFRMNGFEAENTSTNKKIALNGNIINQVISIPRATDPLGRLPVQSNFALVEVNEKNSNITKLIDLLPNRVGHTFEFHMNPMGNVSGHQDFIYSDKVLDVNLDVEVPLYFSSKGMVLCDSSLISINTEDWDKVESGSLLLIAKNKYPLDATIELNLLNESGQVIDQITDQTQKILAGKLESNGLVENATESVLTFPLDQDLINNIGKAKFLKTLIILDTQPSNHAVKLYDKYNIDLQLTADVRYLID